MRGTEEKDAPSSPAATIIFTLPDKTTPLITWRRSRCGSAPFPPSTPQEAGPRLLDSDVGPGAKLGPGSSHQKGLINFGVWLPAAFSRLIKGTGPGIPPTCRNVQERENELLRAWRALRGTYIFHVSCSVSPPHPPSDRSEFLSCLVTFFRAALRAVKVVRRS